MVRELNFICLLLILVCFTILGRIQFSYSQTNSFDSHNIGIKFELPEPWYVSYESSDG
jgi:hypothetical protein